LINNNKSNERIYFLDKQQTTKMPKPFDNNDGLNASAASGNQQQFVLREDDRLKEEEDYRQGKF
jgi:hypothetical protein